MHSCSGSGRIPKVKVDPLVGCNGQPHSTAWLKYLLYYAEKNEDFELCALYRDEINKRHIGLISEWEKIIDETDIQELNIKNVGFGLAE